jgi:hypothetical protein
MFRGSDLGIFFYHKDGRASRSRFSGGQEPGDTATDDYGVIILHPRKAQQCIFRSLN